MKKDPLSLIIREIKKNLSEIWSMGTDNNDNQTKPNKADILTSC